MRCFLGFPVTGRLRQQVSTASGQSSGWEVADDLHMTLVFLGELSPERLALITPGVAEVCGKTSTVRQSLGSPALFPTRNSRILALEGEAAPVLAGFREALVRVCEKAGLALASGDFRPHVTLARQWSGEVKGWTPAPLVADSLVLYASGTADERGRRYRHLMGWGLGQGPGL